VETYRTLDSRSSRPTPNPFDAVWRVGLALLK
jgi:hypothetical protein